ncbi:RAD50 [Cordylochernes scorpioides]|uniref:RAD50 n=1 Tax=Cordylochernes scorpioides TaxID=51811 RepID=A0ABY6K1X9_9ARAC|nr:RAD50 [Cordylochernes scorpioides]
MQEDIERLVNVSPSGTPAVDAVMCSRYRSEGFEEQLDQAREELHQVEESISQKNRELRTLREQLEKLADDTNAQESCGQLREQELKDCLHLAQCRERMDQWRRQVEQLEEEIAELGIDPARGTQLAGSVQKLHAELGQAQGRLKELQEQVRSSQQELAHPDFSQAGEKFRVAAIDRRVTELTLADLKKYYDTLDRAVIEFHRIKMNELNKIIRDLWNTVYRGNDIEYIEIVSDVDEARRNTERVRQSYNYKVVMSKNGAKLDMRSHSSAGQKVLASLIIRLALAETFCLHCGIFALDEPTTNLDSDNIESLAHALVNLVESRVSRKNFQLIIITHDEEFLSLLGRAASLDRYYKVYKNEE